MQYTLRYRMITLFINIRYYSNMERKYKAVGKISRRYTKEEDEIIINEVKNYPTNLLHAFTEAAKKIEGRSVKTISQRWYVYLKKKDDVSALTCGSNKGFTQNVKNVCRDSENNLPEQGLKHYLHVVKELLDLPQKERNLVINLFVGINNINQ